MKLLPNTLLSFVGLILILNSTNGNDEMKPESKVKKAYAKFQTTESEVLSTANTILTKLVTNVAQLENVTENSVVEELTEIKTAMQREFDGIKRIAKEFKVAAIDSCTSDVEFEISRVPQSVSLVKDCINKPKGKAVNDIVINLISFIGEVNVLSANLSVQNIECSVEIGTPRIMCYETLLLVIERATASIGAEVQQKTQQATKIYESLNDQFLQCSATELNEIRLKLEGLVQGVEDCVNELIYSATTTTTPTISPSPKSSSTHNPEKIFKNM